MTGMISSRALRPLNQNLSSSWRRTVDFRRHESLPPIYNRLIDELNSCETSREIYRVHGRIVKTGLEHDSFAVSKLLAFSLRDVRYAASIFEHVKSPNLYMFNTMIRGYSNSEEPRQAFVVFSRLRTQGFDLDQFSFITILKSCVGESEIAVGEGIHGIVLKSGFVSFVNLKNTLLHFYCAHDRIRDALKVFDEILQRNDAVSFNTLMSASRRSDQFVVVLELFKLMQKSGVSGSVGTLSSVLLAVGELGDLSSGESIHGYCYKLGFALDSNLITALTDMYGRTRNIELARRVFQDAPYKDVVLWNCMIDKYAKAGLLQESLTLLRQMDDEQVKPNSSTFVGLLSSCAANEAAGIGLRIAKYVEDEGLALDCVLGTALVDMYAKFGFLDKAMGTFERMENKDVKSWTAMIMGYGSHGLTRNAIELFHRMEMENFRPNEVTFLAVLSSCSHGGLVREGIRCFKKMVEDYHYIPKIEHYGCLIDLLARAGLLEEAYDLIVSLPIKGDVMGWRALLASCRVYGNAEVAERAKVALEELGESHPSDSILLSGIYVSAGSVVGQRVLSTEMCKEKKEAGYSSVFDMD